MREGVEERVKSREVARRYRHARALQAERTQLANRAQALTSELEQLQRTTSSAVDAINENERLRRTLAENEHTCRICVCIICCSSKAVSATGSSPAPRCCSVTSCWADYSEAAIPLPL